MAPSTFSDLNRSFRLDLLWRTYNLMLQQEGASQLLKSFHLVIKKKMETRVILFYSEA